MIYLCISLVYCSVYCVCDAVPASPTGVSVLRLNGTHMNVSWNRVPLSVARGFIVSYTVLYSKVTTGRKRRQVKFVTVPGSETSVVIGDLNPSISYQVFVSAANSAGFGQSSSNAVVAKSKLTIVITLTRIYFLQCAVFSYIHVCCIICISLHVV